MARKTLANCLLDEFMVQAYKTREAFYALYHAVNVDAIREQYGAERDAADTDEERRDISRRFVDDLLRRLMLYHAKELLPVIAALGFLTQEEAKALPAAEAMEIVTECITNKSVMTFFIRLERLAADATGGILPLLLLIASAASGGTTSETASQSKTSGTSAETSASAISQTVSEAQ